MKTRVAMIRQYIDQAQKQAKELSALCQDAKDEEKLNSAFEIEMGLEWTGRKVVDFQTRLASTQ